MHLRVRGRQEPTSHLPLIFLFSFPRKITHAGPCKCGPTISARTLHHRVQHQNFLPASPLEKKLTLPLGKAEEEQKNDPGNGRNRTAVGSALLDFNLHNDTCYHYTTSP
jgi:hypothetical protein